MLGPRSPRRRGSPSCFRSSKPVREQGPCGMWVTVSTVGHRCRAPDSAAWKRWTNGAMPQRSGYYGTDQLALGLSRLPLDGGPMMTIPALLGLATCVATHPPCSCVRGPDLASRAEAAAVDAFAAVFEGTVVRTEYPDLRPGAPRERQVTLTVGRRWKGVPTDTVIVRTPAATESCGADFVDGREYIVFANAPSYSSDGVARPSRAGEVVYATKCGPITGMARNAERIAALLGEPLPPGRATSRPRVPEA